jgi:hypothetical protein
MIAPLVTRALSATHSRAVQAGTTALLVPAAATTLHAVGVSTDLNTAVVSQGLIEPNLWVILGICALFGGIGGVVAELLSLRGHIEIPHRVKPRGRMTRPSRLSDPRNEIDLGIFARVMLGAAAALALLAIVSPSAAAALIVNSLIAGSAATAVLRLVQGRLLGKSDATASRPAAQAAARNNLSVVAPATPAKVASSQ